VFDAHIPSATWPAKIGQALNEWSDLSGIDYVEVAYDDGASFPISVGIDSVRPDIRIGGHSIDGRGGILAYCGYPNGGDMVIDTDDWRSYDNTGGDYLVLRNIVSHENGHGIGLGHVIPANGTKLMEPYASTAFDGPQDDDIRGGQRLYGDWLENNDDPSEPTDLGALSGAVTYENISIDKGGVDEDWFLLSAPGGGELSVTLKPVGSTYNVGPQGGSASSINTKAITDLELSIYDGSGTVVEHYQNDTGPGLDEVLSAFPLVPGDHFIRVSRVADSANAIQRYTLMVTFDVSTAVADRGELAPGPAAADLAVRPNPFNPATSIELSGAFGENRQVRIYDAAGREVNRFALSSATAGTATVRWDGTDLSGRELPSGVYFVRACGSEGETVRKALLIR